MLQEDGKVLLGGDFTTVGGVQRNLIARLENAASTQSLAASSPARVQWLRGGSSPETAFVTFELSTNGGSAWTLLGTGTRIPGGWELTGLHLPANGQVRARARTTGGYGGGSTGLLETIAPFTFTFTPLEAWRQTWFSTTENNGDAGDNADPDHDGLENLIEFAFGLNPLTADAGVLPAWVRSDDDYVLTCTRPASVSGISYVAEYSDTLAPESWVAIPSGATPPDYTFYAPPGITGRLYLRLRVTAP
jgi:hypothetical protein